MSLTVGSRLGPFEILGAIGAGGMGEVYRARDTRFDRDVAIKVLPAAFTSDPDRVARFQREAKLLASLNDPHIATIHGLEQTGDTYALVMELVEGQDLAHRITRGAIPLDEALPIARQIAEALEVAHGQGIIHRDLKPANIKVRDDGTVKVLDFGLAKLTQLNSGPVDAGELSHSPTLTAMGTMQGLILGTAAYMSPEQARGRVVDKRTDIWAFGVVLFEMLSGTRAFEGEDATETIAAVVKTPPDWNALPTDLPAHILTLIKRCLEKDRKARIGDIAVARFLLDGSAAFSSVPVAAMPLTIPPPPFWRRALPWSVAATAVIGAVALLFVLAPWRTVPVRVAKLTMTPPGNEELAIDNNNRDIAISPDGTRVVFATGTQPNYRWYMRSINSLSAVWLSAVPPSAENPFWSPDGLWVGFSDESPVPRKLFKVLAAGGRPVAICVVPGGGSVRGATWGADNTIVYGTTGASSDGTSGRGLYLVSADGGTPQTLTTPAERTRHLWPSFLPGGRAIVFSIVSDASNGESKVVAFDVASKRQTELTAGSSPKYAATGHLLFGVDGTIHAAGFDASRLSATSAPVPVVDGVVGKASGMVDFDIAADGTLVYVEGSNQAAGLRTLVWVDRQGKEEPINVQPHNYVYARLSPDGTQIALDARDGENDIWIYNVSRQTTGRLTVGDPGMNRMPVWSPDSKKVAFTSVRDKWERVFWQAADGSAPAEPLSPDSMQFPHGPQSFSPDGKSLVVSTPLDATANTDMWVIALDGDRRGEKLITGPFYESNGVVSPDGHWLAYDANDSDRTEVYLRPWPNVNGSKTPVSTNGGTRSLWSRDGKELFYYVEPGTIMAVTVQTTPKLVLGPPRVVVKGKYALATTASRHYDVSLDGQKFLMLKDVVERDIVKPRATVVLNWFEELRTKIPQK